MRRSPKPPFVHRSIMSAMIIVNLDWSRYTSATLQLPARSLSSRPGAVWCRMVNASKSVCSEIPTASTLSPLPPLDLLGGGGVRTLLPARNDTSLNSPACALNSSESVPGYLMARIEQ